MGVLYGRVDYGRADHITGRGEEVQNMVGQGGAEHGEPGQDKASRGEERKKKHDGKAIVLQHPCTEKQTTGERGVKHCGWSLADQSATQDSARRWCARNSDPGNTVSVLYLLLWNGLCLHANSLVQVLPANTIIEETSELNL